MFVLMVPGHNRGLLGVVSRWGQIIAPGILVGNSNTRIQGLIWQDTVLKDPEWAQLIWNVPESKNPLGYEGWVHGTVPRNQIQAFEALRSF